MAECNDPNDVLYGFEATKRRAKQLEINCEFLLNAIETIHHNLCPGPGGTWQDRVNRAVKAAKLIAKEN